MRSTHHKLFYGLLSLILLGPAIVAAGDPEYAKLRSGEGVSIAGFMDDSGRFVADEIERLDSARSPKIRGPVQAVSEDGTQITVLGHTIRLAPQTLMLPSERPLRPEKIAVGMQIEIRCALGDEGEWVARSVAFDGVKPGMKLKGTVRSVILGGAEGDRLDVSGLVMELRPFTDIVDDEEALFEELFAELKEEDGLSTAAGSGSRLGERVLLTGSYRQEARLERGYQLRGRGADELRRLEPSLRLEASGRWGNGVSSFVQLRAQDQWLLGDTPVGRSPVDTNAELQIRQAYVLARDIAGSAISLSVGKQRMRDSREFLFDEYLDAARLYYHGARFLVFEASYLPSLVPLKDKIQSWNDLVLQTHFFLGRDGRASLFWLRRWDSDDARGREPSYAGFSFDQELWNRWSLWADASWLRGEDKGRPLRSHHWDIGATHTLSRVRGRPHVTLAHARGSGDSRPDDDTDGAYHQTGYQDNSGRFGGIVNFQRFGEVLDPELTNLRVTTMGIGVRPSKRSSLDLIHHRYRQDVLLDELDDTDLELLLFQPDGSSDELGSAWDVVFGISGLWDRASLIYAAGLFRPGDALGSTARDVELHRFQIRVDF